MNTPFITTYVPYMLHALTYVTRFIHYCSGVFKVNDHMRNMLLRGKVTHVAFIARTQNDHPIYITTYDLEQKNIFFLIWHICIQGKRFENSRYCIPTQNIMSFVNIEYTLTVCRDDHSKQHMLISTASTKNPNSYPVLSTSAMNTVDNMVYCNAKVYGKYVDVTTEVKQLLRACISSGCCIPVDICCLILLHFFRLPIYNNEHQEFQIMDGNTFEEHIFKGEDVLLINE